MTTIIEIQQFGERYKARTKGADRWQWECENKKELEPMKETIIGKFNETIEFQEIL